MENASHPTSGPNFQCVRESPSCVVDIRRYIVVQIAIVLNPRPGRAFSITRTGRRGGGCYDPPLCRFETRRRSASQQRPSECSRRDLAIERITFGPRSIFDLVMAGQRSNFGKISIFVDFARLQRRRYGRYRHGVFTSVFLDEFGTRRCIV